MTKIIDTEEYSTSGPFISFSVESIANKKFVQIAPYLVIDVFRVEQIGDQLAGIYIGGPTTLLGS